MQLLTVVPRAAFRLNKNVRLQATISVRLYVPIGLLRKGEEIADAVDLSRDDVEIGLKQALNNPEKLSAIIVFLKPMDTIMLRRSAEVIAESDQSGDIVFNILD